MGWMAGFQYPEEAQICFALLQHPDQLQDPYSISNGSWGQSTLCTDKTKTSRGHCHQL